MPDAGPLPHRARTRRRGVGAIVVLVCCVGAVMTAGPAGGAVDPRLVAAGNAVCRAYLESAISAARPEAKQAANGGEYYSGAEIRSYLSGSGKRLRRFAGKFAALDAPADQRPQLARLVRAFREIAAVQEKKAGAVSAGRVTPDDYLDLVFEDLGSATRKPSDAAEAALTALGFTACLGS